MTFACTLDPAAQSFRCIACRCVAQRVHDHASAAGTLDRENNAVNVPDGWVRCRTDAYVIALTSASCMTCMHSSMAVVEIYVHGGRQAAREGAQLIGGLQLGKALGQGFQVRCVSPSY